MSPEVQAAIIKAASDWALFITKTLPPTKYPKRDLLRLKKAFTFAYEIIGNIVEP